MDARDAGAGVREDEAEKGEADPAWDVEASARGGDGEDDHDGEAGEGERDDEFEVYAARIGGEENEGGDSRQHARILREGESGIGRKIFRRRMNCGEAGKNRTL